MPDSAKHLKKIRVPDIAIGAILETAEEAGIDRNWLLKQVDLKEQPFNTGQPIATTHTMTTLVEAARSRVDIPGFGLKVGRKQSLDSYGVFGYALISSRNLRQGLALRAKFDVLMGGGYILISNFEKGDRFYSEVHIDMSTSSYFIRFFLEEMFASIAVTLEKLFDRSPTLLDLCLAYPQPDYVDLYKEIFNCPIYFDQDFNKCSYPASLLDEPFVLANDSINKTCEEHCEVLMSKFDKTGRVTDLVRSSLFLNPGESNSVQTIAQKLGMSVRTLQRALQAEDTSFNNILFEVRMSSAAYYLKCTNLPPKNIAYLVGYSEVPNFYRSFKRWSGMTPNVYRSQAQVGKA